MEWIPELIRHPPDDRPHEAEIGAVGRYWQGRIIPMLVDMRRCRDVCAFRARYGFRTRMRKAKRTPDLLPPHHPLDLVAEEHVTQHQAAHHGLGLGKLGNGHVEIIRPPKQEEPSLNSARATRVLSC